MSLADDLPFDDSAKCEVTVSGPFSRRIVLAALAGIGTVAFQRALAAQATQAGKITPELIEQAEWIAGIKLADEDRQAVAAAVQRDQRKFEALRQVDLKNSVPPALSFFAAPPPTATAKIDRKAIQPLPNKDAVERPILDDDLAFLPVTKLAALLKAKKITSTELTKLYLARLKKFDPLLKCVVTLTEELALKQAQRADEEIAAVSGPLAGNSLGGEGHHRRAGI